MWALRRLHRLLLISAVARASQDTCGASAGGANCSRGRSSPSPAVLVSDSPWIFWRSEHPDPEKSARQELEYQEHTSEELGTGLCSGLLRILPEKELPRHYHTIGEVYHFTRGDGVVKLGEAQTIPIKAGLTVNIPNGTMHGIFTGKEGVEFVWMFAAKKWADIAYYYEDPALPTIWR